MINRTSPDLKAINETADFNVQFYAIIGAATSLAAELEQELFVAYLAASGLADQDAAQVFYAKVQFGHKRDVTDAAVRAALETFALDLDWTGMLEELNDLCGEGTARNLIGHNRARQEIIIQLSEGDSANVYVANYVEQNEHMVAAKRRQPQKETYGSLFDYCERAIRLAKRLRFTGSQIRKARSPSA